MKAVLFALALLGWGTIAVIGHSWVDCSDWRPNDTSNPRFKDGTGTCYGYPRKYPAGSRAYGTYDGFQWYRHYVQNPDWKNNPAQSISDNAPVCRPYNPNDGSDERRQSPVERAYYPNTDSDQNTVGPMTEKKAGDPICFRWPAKNHAGHVNDQNMVFVYWAPNPDTADPSQPTMLQNEVARMRFRNCPDPGPASASDQTGTGSDRMACGGCFTVPNKPPGTYLVQWRWMLNQGEFYSTCMDIKITANPNPPTPTRDVDPTQGGEAITISASITVRIPKAPGDIDISLFVSELASILDIPVSAIDRVEVQLDQSTDNPPSTVIVFVITNADGVDPIAKARELKQLAESNDPKLENTQNLQGLEVLSVDSNAAVTLMHFSSAVMIAVMALSALFF